MVRVKWQDALYPLYLRIRLHSPVSSYIQWALALSIFFQFTIFPLYLQTPTTYLKEFQYQSPLPYMQCIVFFNTWLFSTPSLFLDNLIFFIIFIVFYSIWINVILKMRKNMYISYPTMNFIRFFQQILTKIITLPLLYKFVSTAQMCYEKPYVFFIISVVISSLNIILNGFDVFISSVFLDSADFVFASKVDTYDGKNQFSLYISKILVIVAYAAFSLFRNSVLYSIMAASMFLLAIYIFYIRVFTKATVTYLGSFFESAPFVALPFHILIHIFFNNIAWIITVGVTIIIYILYAIFLYYFSIHAENRSIRVFSGFIKKNSELDQEKELPFIASGSQVAILRNIAAAKNDPTIFERFLLMQKRVGYVTSQLLEITRFLALFPSKRDGLISLLENQQTNSAYNKWMLYLFLERLKLLVTCNSEREYPEIKMLIDTYVIYYQRFWQCRAQKKRFQAMNEALRAAFYSRELSIAIRDHARLCPKDSQVYENLALYYLFMEADSKGSMNLRITSKEIKQKKYHVLDPILSKMSIIYPKILQFCEPSELKMSRIGSQKQGSEASYGFTETSNSNPSQDTNRGINSPNQTTDQEFKLPYIETKMVASKENIPWNAWLMHIIPVICLTLYFISIRPFGEKNDRLGNVLIKNVNYSIQTLYNSTASLYMSSLEDVGVDFSKKSSKLQCQYEILMTPHKIIGYIAKMPDIQELSELILPLTFDLFKNQTHSNESSCNFLSTIGPKMMDIAYSQILELNKTNKLVYDSLDSISNHIDKGYNALPHTSVFLVAFLFIGILILTISCQVNSKLNLSDEVIDYISSDTRRRRSMRKEYDEVFDDLKKLIIKDESIKQTQLSMSTGCLQVTLDCDKSNDIKDTQDLKKQTLKSITSKNLPRNASNVMLLAKGNMASNPINKNTENNFPEKTDEEIDFESEQIYERSKYANFRIYFEMFGTLIVTTISCFAFFAILSNRSLRERSAITDLYNKTPVIMHSLQINSMLLSLIQGKRPDGLTEFIDHLQATTEPSINKIYTDDNCYSLSSLTCVKISSLLNDLLTVDVNDNGIILETFAPILMKFQRRLLNLIIQDATDISKIPHSPFCSFIICISIISIFVIIFAIQWYIKIRKSINCLFNFPGEKDDEKSVRNEPEKSTNRIIVVSAITETGEIYSISENDMRILGRYPIDFITQDLNQTFPVLDESHRQYTMPDRRTKRIFRSTAVKRNFLTKLIMIEEPNNDVQSVEAVTQKMSAIMPPHYAKIFAEEGQVNRFYKECIVIFIKVSLKSQASVVDRFFPVINMLSQNFGRVKLLRSDSNLLTYLNDSNDTPLTSLLFVRDILTGTSSKMKIPHGSPDYPIESVVILNVHELKLELVESVEPFLDISTPDYDKYQRYVRNLPPRTIAITPIVAETPIVNHFGILTDTMAGSLYLSDISDFICHFTI